MKAQPPLSGVIDRRVDPGWPPMVLSALLALLTVTAFFPGAMSADSILQFSQACTGVYQDDHPPIMAGLWRLLLQLWPHPGVLFLAQVLSYWSFWCAFSLALSRRTLGRILILGAACLPPLWSQATVIWKDSEISIAILGAYLLAVLSTRQEGQGWGGRKAALLVSSLLLFLYSAAVRKNAFLLLLPLAFYSAFCVFPKISRFRASLWALAWVGAGFLATAVINTQCFNAAKGYSFQAIEAFDIVGVYSQTRRADLLPHYWKTLDPVLEPEALIPLYDPASRNSLFVGNAPLKMTTDPAYLRDLREKWLQAIRLFPLAYLHHRWNSFRILLGIGLKDTYYPLQLTVVPNPLGIGYQCDPGLLTDMASYFILFQNSILFRGWFYLLAILALLFYRWRRLPGPLLVKDPCFCAALSALLYILGYFPAAPSSDFRYLYPAISLVFFSVILALAPEADGRKGRKP